jgi:3-hydroxyisobutyrate dehydrogenase
LTSERIAPRLRAGVIGVGAMGMAVARRLLDAGFQVCVRDVRPEAERDAAAAGALVCTSPAALAAQCDAIVTLVVDAQQTEDVLFGAQGVAQAMHPDAVLLVMSTVPPAFAESVAQRLGALGRLVLDAPCSGGPAKARSGQMSMMIAGSQKAMARAAPLLEAIAARRMLLGERPGDGSRAKLLNNLLAGVNLAAACEAMALGIALGFDPKRLMEVVSVSSGASWVFDDRMPRVLTGDYAPRAALDILRKDLGIAQSAAQQRDFPTPIADAARALFDEASRRGWGKEDDAALIKVFAALAGVELPKGR